MILCTGFRDKAHFVVVMFVMLVSLMPAQSSWDEQARQFVSTAEKNRYKYTIQQVGNAIDKSTALINAYCKTCSQEQLSALYLARANLRMYQLDYRADSADGGYTPSPSVISIIKNDFAKAQTFCQSCKCGMHDNVVDFYSAYGTQKQMDSLRKEAWLMGKPTDHSYLGVDVNFIAPMGVVSAAVGFMSASTVRQPKRWAENAKRYRKCKYEYPTSVGYCFVGYETSMLNTKYTAFKLDPVWFNSVIAVHPLQLLYANNMDGKTVIYRPELGFSFSVFSVNYALNIPFKGSFGYIAQHNVSIRFAIPAIRLN